MGVRHKEVRTQELTRRERKTVPHPVPHQGIEPRVFIFEIPNSLTTELYVPFLNFTSLRIVSYNTLYRHSSFLLISHRIASKTEARSPTCPFCFPLEEPLISMNKNRKRDNWHWILIFSPLSVESPPFHRNALSSVDLLKIEKACLPANIASRLIENWLSKGP